MYQRSFENKLHNSSFNAGFKFEKSHLPEADMMLNTFFIENQKPSNPVWLTQIYNVQCFE